MSKNLHRTACKIVRGGVYVAHGAIFEEGNPISRSKNRYLADFTTGIQRIQVKSGGRLDSLWESKSAMLTATPQIKDLRCRTVAVAGEFTPPKILF